jgi:hypothetical protein
VWLQDALPLVHVPAAEEDERPEKKNQRPARRDGHDRRRDNDQRAGGRCLLDEEGDELISVRVEGVLDAVADARNAVQLRGGHGCRLPVVWCDGGGE